MGFKKRMAGTEFKIPSGGADRRVTRRSLWTGTDGSVSEEEPQDEATLQEAESPDPDRVKARARFTLNGGHDWRNFKPEDYSTMLRISRKRGDFSVPLGFEPNRSQSLNRTESQSSASEKDDSIRANSNLDTSSAGISPRGELSQNSVSSTGTNVSMVDLTGASSEDDRESTSFSPFLAKRPRTVVNVGSTSSNDEVMETSAVEAEKEKEVVEKDEQDSLDASVILESNEQEGSLDEEKC